MPASPRPLRARRPLPGSFGFTLIEIAIVLILISIISLLAFSTLTQALLRSKSVEAIVTVSAIERSLKEYYTRNDRFPSRPAEFNPPISIRQEAEMELGREDGWADIGFVPEGKYRYRYEWIPEVDDDGRVSAVTIHATVDTNGDDIWGHIYHRMYEGSTGFLIEELIFDE